VANNLDFTFTGKDKTQQAFQSLNRSVSKTQKGFDKLKGAISFLSTAGGVALVGTFGAMATSLNKTADRIGKVSSKLGVSTEALQKLQFSAEQSGVSTETLNMAFQRFTRRIADARQGTGTALKAFQQMGISLQGVGGRAKTAEELFFEVADSMKGMESETEKVSLAFKFFDSEGVSLVNMLQNGSGVLKDFGNQLESVGGIIDSKAIKATERFNDALNLLSKASRGIFSDLVLGIDDFINRVPKALSKIQKFIGGEEFKIDFNKAFGMSAKELEQVFEASTDELQRLDGVLKNVRDTRKQMNKGEIFYTTILKEENKLNEKQKKLFQDRSKLLELISKKTGKTLDLTKDVKDEQVDINSLIRVENLGVEAIVKQKNISKKLSEQTIDAIESQVKPTLILNELEEDNLDLYRKEVAELKKQTSSLKQNKEIAKAFVGGIRSASAQASRFFDAVALQIVEVGKSIELTFSTNWIAILTRFAMSSKKVMGIVDKIFSTFGEGIDSIFDKLLPGIGDSNELILNTGNTIGEVLEKVQELGTEIDEYNLTISGITDEARAMALIEKQYLANRSKADDLGSGFLGYVADLTKQQAILARTTERVARATEAFKQSASSYITALETAGFTELQKDLFLQAKGFITGPLEIFSGIIKDSTAILTTAKARLPTAEAEKTVLQTFIDESDLGRKKVLAKSSDFLMSILGDQLAIIEKGVSRSDFTEDVKLFGVKIGERFDATGFINATVRYQEAILAFTQAIPDKAMELLNGEIKSLTDSIQLQNGIVSTNTDLMNKAQGGLLQMVKETIKSEFESGKSKDAILADIDIVSTKLKEAGLNVTTIREFVNALVAPASGAMGGLVKKYPYGGKIYGPSHGAGGVNANLEGGEFVMSRSAVKKYGSQFMSSVNNGSMGQNVVVNIYDGTGQKISEFESGLRVEINQRANRYNEFPALSY